MKEFIFHSMFKYRSFSLIRNIYDVLEHYIKEYVLPFTLKLNLSQSLCPLFRHTFNKRNNIDFVLIARLLSKKFLPFPFFVFMKFHTSRIFKINVELIHPRVKNVFSYPFVNSCIKLILCCI